MKKLILIIGVILQFSSAGFSQESQKSQPNVRLIHIVNPVAILRVHRSDMTPTNSNTIALITDNKAVNNHQYQKIATDSIVPNYNSSLYKLTSYVKE